LIGTASGPFSVDFLTHDLIDGPTIKTFSGNIIKGVVSTYSLNLDSSGGVVVASFCPADVNGDGKVDAADLAIIRSTFGSRIGQSEYNSRADLNHDGVINVIDLAFASKTIGCSTLVQ
jgi:hypothetical protein